MIQIDYAWSDGTKDPRILFCDHSSGYVPKVREFVSLHKPDGWTVGGRVVDVATTIHQGSSATSVIVLVLLRQNNAVR